MATNDTNRVKKDISARKQPDVLSESKAKVESMRHELLLQTVNEGYQKLIEDLRAAHAEEIASLKNELAMAFEAGAAKARSESDATSCALRQNIDALSKDRDDLKKALTEEIHKKNVELTDAETRIMMLQAQLDDQKATHERQVARLQKQVAVGPNSWMEITFVGATRAYKPRTYVRRPSARFRDAVEEMCKALGKPLTVLVFKHKGRQIFTHEEAKTLAQVFPCVCFVWGRKER